MSSLPNSSAVRSKIFNSARAFSRSSSVAEVQGIIIYFPSARVESNGTYQSILSPCSLRCGIAKYSAKERPRLNLSASRNWDATV